MKKYPTSGAANKRLLSCWACCLLLACFQEMFLFVFVLRRITVYFAIVLNRNQVKHGLKLQIFRGVFQGFIGGVSQNLFTGFFSQHGAHMNTQSCISNVHMFGKGGKSPKDIFKSSLGWNESACHLGCDKPQMTSLPNPLPRVFLVHLNFCLLLLF